MKALPSFILVNKPEATVKTMSDFEDALSDVIPQSNEISRQVRIRIDATRLAS